MTLCLPELASWPDYSTIIVHVAQDGSLTYEWKGDSDYVLIADQCKVEALRCPYSLTPVARIPLIEATVYQRGDKETE